MGKSRCHNFHKITEGNLVTLINVFETTPKPQQALIDQWTRTTSEIQEEPGVIGIALHKSTDGTRMINYGQWRSQADFDTDLSEAWRGIGAVQPERLTHRSPYQTRVVYLYERSGS